VVLVIAITVAVFAAALIVNKTGPKPESIYFANSYFQFSVRHTH
jgi:hypothetical protein